MKAWSSSWVLGGVGIVMGLGGLIAGCEKAPPAATPTGQAVAVGAPEAAAPAPTAPAPAPTGGSHPGMPPGHGGPQGLPAGHPPIAGHGQPGSMGQPRPGTARPMAPMAGAQGMGDLAAESGVEMPLVLEGAGSIAELKGRLSQVSDASLHAALEEAFRKVFTIDRPKRDNARASALLEPLASHQDTKVSALAERVLGYVRINSNFDAEGAKTRYIKAIELDPDYGEAHYALAFTYAISDLAKGKEHFERAMALGVPDTRQLRTQFFAD